MKRSQLSNAFLFVIRVTMLLSLVVSQFSMALQPARAQGLPPVAPTDLSATAISRAEVDLTWTDNSGNSETGFKLEASPSGQELWDLLLTTGPDTTHITYTPLVCGTAYDFRIRATNADGDSVPSNVAAATTFACNSAPVITEGASVPVVMSENGSPTAFNLTLHATDADAGDTLTWFYPPPGPSHGIVYVGSAGNVNYIPETNYVGPDTFYVGVSDGNGGQDIITIDVTVEFVPLTLAAPDCAYGGFINSITATDRYTVTFNLCKPDAAFLSKISMSPFGIHPQEWIAATSGSTNRTTEGLEHPIGTGPYKVSTWTHGNSLTMVANPDYWDALPMASTLVFRGAADPSASLGQLQSGAIDGFENPLPSDIPVIQADPALQLVTPTGLNTFYIGMTNTFAPFDDVRVRQAIAMAINRQHIVDTYFQPGSQVATHFTPCAIPNGCAGDAWYDYDPVAARALLTAAGYPDGFTTSLYYRNVARVYLQDPVQVAQNIHDQLLANLGINALLVELPSSGEMVQQAQAGNLNGLHLLGWGADYPHVSNFLEPHFGQNNTQFGSPYPAIYNQLNLAASISDPVAAASYYVAANNAIKDSVPLVPVAHGGFAVAYRADVSNPQASPLNSDRFFQSDPGGRDIFNWTQDAEPTSLFCADEADSASFCACSQVVESLYAFESNGAGVQPALAESCAANADATSFVCSLRQDVLFHDGTAFDANDVVATFTMGLDASDPSHKGNSNNWDYYAGLLGLMNTQPPTFNANFNVWMSWNGVHGYGWPIGTVVSIAVKDAGGTEIYTSSDTSHVAPWDSNGTAVEFNLGQAVAFQPGYQVTLSGGGVTKVQTIPVIQITAIDLAAETISGTAPVDMPVDVNINNSSAYRHVTAGADGIWLADFAHAGLNGNEQTLYDIVLGTNGNAIGIDVDADGTGIDWNVPNPTIVAFLPNNPNATGSVGGDQWPLGTPVTLTIDDPAIPGAVDYTDVKLPAPNTNDPRNTWIDFPLNNFYMRPRQVITFANGSTTKTLTVTDMQITEIDTAADTISGLAGPGLEVQVWADNPDGWNDRWTIAAPDGSWSVDFSVPVPNGAPAFDLVPGSTGQAKDHDAERDNTQIGWNVPNPSFNVRANENKIDGWQWPAGSVVTITVNRPGESISRQATVMEHASWDPNSPTYFEYNFGNEFDVKSGDLVSVTDGITSKSTTVTSLAFTDIDLDADIVTGVASPGANVNIWVCNDSDCNYNRHVLADGTSGVWQADFGQVGVGQDEQTTVNIGPRSWIDSSENDVDGDGTMYGENIPNPRIEVAPYSNWIHGRDWPVGAVITLSFDDPSNGIGEDFSANATVMQNPNNPGDPNDFMADFPWPAGFAPGPGYSISMTDGATAKTYTVANLQVTAYDFQLDTVSGMATPGADVQVCINLPDHCAARYVTADASGNWTADYGHVGPRSDEQELIALEVNITNGWAAERNLTSDQTWYDWTAQIPACPAGNSVTGAVFFGNGVSPIQGATVHFENYYSGDSLFTTTTGVDGAYGCDLPDGNYRIWADSVDLGFSREYYHETILETAGLVYVAAGLPVSGINFSLDTPMFGFQHLTFNMNNPVVADLAVRQAIAYGTDRELMRAATNPNALIPDSYMPSTYWAYPTIGLPVYTFDPAHARQILQDAGWVDADMDGVREKAGVRLHIDYATNSNNDPNSPRTRFAQIFVANMAAIGVEIAVNDGPGAIGSSAGIKQFAWAGIDLNLDAGPDMMQYSYYSGHAWNYGSYSSLLADGLLNSANLVNTRAEKLGFLQQHQVQVMTDLAVLPLVEYGGPSLPYPSFSARLNENQVHGYGWALGEQVMLQIDDPATLDVPDFAATTLVGVADWNPNETFARFDLGAFVLAPGQTISMTDGIFSRSHVVADIQVIAVDSLMDTISGTAQPGSHVEVGGGNCGPNGCAIRRADADVSGNWSVDFSAPGGMASDEQIIYDIQVGDGNEVRQPDNDGDNTVVQWRAARPRPVYLKASPDQDWVHARGWLNGAVLTLSVDDPATPATEDYSTTASMQQASWDPFDPDDLLAIFDLSGLYDLKSGDVLTVTDGNTLETAVVPAGMTQLRWFVGITGYTSPAQIAAQQQVVDDFNQARPTLEVLFEMQPDPNTAYDVLKTAMQAGNAPDIIGPTGLHSGNQFPGEWLDLTGLIASSGYDTSQFDPSLMQMYNTGEGQTGLPFMVFPSVLYYQKAMFDAAGLNYPPASYGAEYVMPDGSHVEWNFAIMSEVARLLTLDAAGRNATEPGFDRNNIVQYGYVPQWQSLTAQGSLWGPDSLYAGTPGSYTAELPSQWSLAWRWIYDGMWGSEPFMPTGPVSNSPDYGGNPFASGKVAMLVNQAWYQGYAGSNWDLAAIPAYMGAVNGLEHADNFRIWKDTPHSEQAFEFLRYLTDDASSQLLSAYGGMPARASQRADYFLRAGSSYPWVTNWSVLESGLNYVDIPSNEAWMPNLDTAWSYLQSFQDKLFNDGSLDMTVELARLRYNLEAIFNGQFAHDPVFEVQLMQNEVHGFDWPAGNPVTMTIDDLATFDSPDYTDTQVSSAVNPWGTTPLVMFTNIPALSPGQVVTLSDGVFTKSHIVQFFEVTIVDQLADKLHGMAAPNATMRAWSHWPTCCSVRTFTADGSGAWMADFSIAGSPQDPAVDLAPNVSGQVTVYDEDGDSTNLPWWVPDPAFGKTLPADGVTGSTVSPMIAWEDSAGATDYQYCLDMIDNGACDGSWVSVGMATSKALSGLSNGKTYYWQVRAESAAGAVEANAGAWWSFSTQPGNFSKNSPSNGAAGIGQAQALSWISSVGATSYEYCIDMDDNDACDNAWVDAGLATSAIPTGLSRAKTYYWQVRAVYAGGYTEANGGVWWTYSTAPTQFNKSGPGNNAVGVIASPTLSWVTSAGASLYEYCLTTTVQTTGTVCPSGWTPNGTVTSAPQSALENGATYYWQVRASYAGAYYYADAGNWWKFSVIALPADFGKVLPANIASGASTSAIISWETSAGANSYETCVDTVDNSLCDATWTSNGASTSKTLGGLSNGVTYYWQVRAVNTGGATAANGGVWWSFSTQPGNFSKNSPVNGAIGIGQAQALSWQSSAGASSYEYCIDMNDNADCDASWVNVGAVTSVVPVGLSRARTYSWQVRAVFAGGYTYANSGAWWSYSTAPTQFNKSGPANNATGVLLNPALSWGTSTGATLYQYCLTTTVQTTGTVCPSGWTDNGVTTNIDLADLAPGVTYYWQARANYAGAYYYADAGNWWKFSTIGLPAAFGKSLPVNGANGIATSSAISWATSAGANSYETCVDTVDNNLCDATWTSTGTSTSKTLSGLLNGVTYYWQARAVNTGGATEANAGVWWSFSTQPGNFSKNSPVNGAIGIGQAQALSWQSSTGAGSYQYCIDTNNNADCDTSWVNAGSATSAIPVGLSRANTYYWQVRAVYAGGYTYANSGAWWTYSTAPTQFNKSGPANNASGVSLAPTLGWGASTGATLYQYCLTTTVQTTGTVCPSGWAGNGTATNIGLTGLLNGTTYYWQVRASYAGAYYYADAGNWWKFTTLGLPAAFGKSLPANAANGVLLAPVISWAASAGANSYETCVDTVDNSLCDATWLSNGTGTSKTLSGLSNGMTYYWQVRAVNTGGAIAANGGVWWSFSTQPGNFSKNSPANGAIGIGQAQALSWQSSAGASSYQYCIDTNNNADCDTSWVNAGSATSAVPVGLSRARTYYWQVRAVFAGGYTYANSGAWWSYSTAPTQFNKLGPANNASGISLTPTLSWGASTGATLYQYCLTTTVQTTGTACPTGWVSVGTVTSAMLSGLANGTTYYWQVRASYAGAYYYANASAWWKFTTLLP